jgi:hypothetical protein
MGTVSVYPNQSGTVVDVPFWSNSDADLQVAIWWPDTYQTVNGSAQVVHNDVDLLVYSPSGAQVGISQSGPSVFENVYVANDPLEYGNYTIKIRNWSVQQFAYVYYVAYAYTCN